MNHNLDIKIVHGEELAPFLEQLGHLRIQVFRSFPYLYDGDLSYEMNYLSRYLNSSSSRIILCFDGEELVGASTCIALHEESDDLINPMKVAGFHPKEIFYFGESILLPEYRGRGIYAQFFQLREEQARKFSPKYVCFCGVERDDNHPLKPDGYKDLSDVWSHFGFRPLTDVKMQMSWKDIDEDHESMKKLNVWVKEL